MSVTFTAITYFKNQGVIQRIPQAFGVGNFEINGVCGLSVELMYCNRVVPCVVLECPVIVEVLLKMQVPKW